MTEYTRLIPLLAQSGIEFIIVGGFAATIHGSPRLTEDLDIVYSRGPENLKRIVLALSHAEPYLRGAPRGLPFEWSAETLRKGLNFTLTTNFGDIDLLGEIIGGGTYEELRADAIEIEVFGTKCLCLSLNKLIQVKRAAGRPKDFEAIAELESISSVSEKS